jgi:ABC-type sugar transport system ATPase subunit
MNLLRVGLDSNDGELSIVLGAQRLAIPASYATSHSLPIVDGPGVVFGIRPEDVEVLEGSSADALTTRVERREALGAEILVHLSMVDAEGDNAIVVNDAGAVVARPMRLVAKMGPRSGVAVGDHLSVRLNRDHFHFFDADSGDSLRRAPR